MAKTLETNHVLSYHFNQDYTCFIVTTERGFQIFSCNPFTEIYKRSFDGGIGSAEMFFKSNMLGLTGGGTNPKYPLNKAIIWNDEQARPIGEFSFKTAVLGIRLRKDKVAVILETNVYLYDFEDFYLLDAIETSPNPKACCALTAVGAALVAVPSKKRGCLCLKNYSTNTVFDQVAHKSSIVAIALSADGKLCATASSTGTLVRIFATKNLSLLQELRRGKDNAEITCLAFDYTVAWIGCCSNKGTVHVFTVISASKAALALQEPPVEVHAEDSDEEEKEEKVDPKNKTSVFRFMKGIVPYFKSEWSLAQFRLTEKKSMMGFGPKETVYVITETGKFYSASFDPANGGDCKKLEEKEYV
eukprot:TRINITY_DN7348_c0_g6_i1.p1 TRINITY_DN7348_c0_g6~~TRINITY_DN7348_c0_g6_i1.p1  ORF type:complete len:359 (-),score=103.63 TRINITY_DN7348_c0_g6_i1:148-1224(-)